jgi:uncharacterized membrane protein (UPF0136 family)
MAQKITSGIKKLVVVRPSVIATTFSGRSEKFLKQQRLNFVLAALYAVQAIVIAFVGSTANYSIWFHFWAVDPLQTTAQHHTVLTSASHWWFDLNLHFVIVLVLLFAAAGHLLFATALRARYEQALSRRLQDMRWLAGTIIASLLLVAAALLLGVNDAGLLAALIGITVLNGLGTLAVEANQKLWPWGLFVGVGVFAGLLVVAQYVISGLLYGNTLAWSTYAFVAVLAAGVVATLVNLWMQISSKDKWSDYVFAEMMYASIGFVGISACAWILFVGVL